MTEYVDTVQAWDNCVKGSQLLEIIGRSVNSLPWSSARKSFLAVCLDCAEASKHLWKDAKIASNVAILRNWIAGEAVTETAQAAREALQMCYRCAAVYTPDAAAAYTSNVAGIAAMDAVVEAVEAAAAVNPVAAVTAVYAAAAAIGYADLADVGAEARIECQCAGIVRKRYPMPPGFVTQSHG